MTVKSVFIQNRHFIYWFLLGYIFAVIFRNVMGVGIFDAIYRLFATSTDYNLF